MMPLNVIAKMYEEDVPLIKKLLRVIQDKVGARSKALAKIKETAERMERPFKNRPKVERENFDAIVSETTLERIDPTKTKDYYQKFWFFYETTDKAGNLVTQSKDFTTEVDRNTALTAWKKANPDNITFRIMDADAAKAEKFDGIKTKFSSMRPDQQRAYLTLKESYEQVYAELRQTISDRIDALTGSKEQREVLKQKLIYKLLAKEIIEPYFPLYRKGEYWLQYNDIVDGEFTVSKEAFETLTERTIEANKVRADTGRTERLASVTDDTKRKGFIDSGLTTEEANAKLANTAQSGTEVSEYDNTVVNKKNSSRNNVATGFAYDVLAQLQKINAPAETQDLVLNMLLDVMPERSLSRALQPREGTAGFRKDALKVFRDRMPAFVNQVNNIKYDIPLSNAETEIEAEIGEAKRRYPDRIQELQNLNESINSYVGFAKDPYIASWSKGLKSLGFATTLGLNVSSVLVNATNIPIVVYPYLGGKYGYKDAQKALFEAKRLYMNAGKVEGTKYGAVVRKRLSDTYGSDVEELVSAGYNATNIDFSDPKNVPEEYKIYKEVIELMDRRGQANRSLVADALDMEDVGSSMWTKFNAIQGFMFHHGERANRQITALASYKLELDAMAKKKKVPVSGLTEQDRMDAAELAIETTELTNSGAQTETAPKWAQGNIGSIVMMYKRFGISMYYLQARMARQAYMSAGDPEKARARVLENGGTQEEAEEAAQDAIELKRIARRQILGLFASSAMFAGVQGIPLYGLVSFLMNLFGDDEEEDFDSWVAKNITEIPYSGFINAMTGLDAAPRIGMTNLLFRSRPNAPEQALEVDALEYLGGPALSALLKVKDGANLIADGEFYRGVERAMPASIGNVLKGGRFTFEGATTMRGDPITENMGPVSIFGQLIGILPGNYSKQMEINAAQKNIDIAISTNRTRLLRKLYLAKNEGGYKAESEVQREIDAFNTRNPEVPITRETIERSMRQHKLTSQIVTELGGITVNRRRQEKVLQEQADALGGGITLWDMFQ
jgi:hypothetical protein